MMLCGRYIISLNLFAMIVFFQIGLTHHPRILFILVLLSAALRTSGATGPSGIDTHG